MKNKEFVEKNLGKDKTPGRLVRLNRFTMQPRENKEYAEMIFWGDVHLGYPTCNVAKAQAMIDWAVENKVYILGMGDYMEAGLKDSVGDSMYRQTLNPQKQMEAVVEMLTPPAEAGLIIGLHSGNHEHRITKSSGIDITKVMCKLLKVRFLKAACWSLISVGKVRYSIYSLHGASGSRFKHTKMKAVVDTCGWIESDIVAMGHMHGIAGEPIIKQKFDVRTNKIINHKQYVLMTGSYMEWDESYGQAANYPIAKLGSPKAKLYAGVKDVSISLG